MAGERGLAEQIRTRLEDEDTPVPLEDSSPQLTVLDEKWHRKTIRQHVREFSCVMAIVMLLVAGIVGWNSPSMATPFGLFIAALVTLAAGYLKPLMLHPVWRGWMKLAMALGVFMTLLILSLAWVGMMIPVALLLRVLRIKVMDMSWRQERESYWETRDKKYADFKLLERQF